MTTHTETHQLETHLTLRDSSHSPLSVHAITLTLTKQEATLIESRLTFQVTPELYQRINTEALFNLKPQLRRSLTAGEFTSESNIEITASLKPTFRTLNWHYRQIEGVKVNHPRQSMSKNTR